MAKEEAIEVEGVVVEALAILGDSHARANELLDELRLGGAAFWRSRERFASHSIHSSVVSVPIDPGVSRVNLAASLTSLDWEQGSQSFGDIR